MVYLEGGTKFWKCDINGTTTTMVFGTVGTPGQNRVKVHPTAAAAESYMKKMADQKIKKDGLSPKGKGAAAAKATGGGKAKSSSPNSSAKAKPAPRATSTPRAKRKSEAASPSSPAKKPRTSSAVGKRTVDSRCPHGGLKVIDDYAVKLNQTNVGANNNKYYIIQALEGGGSYYAWNRWGRVGDPGNTKLMPCATQDKATNEFEKKFREKTGNDWSARDSFVPKSGKYKIVETEDSGGGEQAPMGKLTEAQIAKGQAVLDKLSAALRKGSDVTELSSQFYTMIPTNFGWKKPVPINSKGLLEEKQELLKFYLRMGFEKVEADAGVSPIEGLMELALPRSLDEAARGLCGSGSISSSNSKGRELADSQAGRPKSEMTPALYGAIMLYTSNAIYADLNKCLRDKNRAKIKKYFKYLRLLFEAMGRLPQQKKTIWRGISTDLSSDPQYSPGKVVTWWGVSSCTSDSRVAQGFANGCGGGCTICTVHSTSACDISSISFFSNEKESLLKPGTQLKVKSRTKKGAVTEIVLQEVGCSIG